MENFIMSIINSGARIEKKFGTAVGIAYLIAVTLIILTIFAGVAVGLFIGMIDGFVGPKLFGSGYIGYIR